MKSKLALVFLLLAFLAAGCASSGKQASLSPDIKTVKATKPSQAEIKAQVLNELKTLGGPELAKEEEQAEAQQAEGAVTYDIPITINAQVNHFIDYFQTKVPKRFKIWLERSGRYIPMMREILKKHGLPEDLVYLAMIESGFSCRAYSRAHACGPWQFIRGTGRRYGLKISYWLDERRDPVKATHAAAKYLKDLYAEFGSWYLAAAAYNAGEAKIRRAMKRYRADDFWDISKRRRRYLKRETKNYVPKMIAAAIIAKQPAKYGFDNLKYHAPIAYDLVRVHPATSLSVAAKLAGVKTRSLRELNPELSRWATPPGHGMYSLRVPSGKKAAFETAYAKLSPKERGARARAARVKIHRGDTLGRIAKSFRVSLRDLMALNPHLRPRRLKPGQVVFVPPGRTRRSYRRARAAKPTRHIAYRAPHRNQRKIVHVVKKGDSLWEIAQAYGINHRDIKRWNGRRSNRLSIGQKLVLYVPQAKAEAKLQRPDAKPKAQRDEGTLVYRVRRGDSLWKIARKYKVTPAALRRWNGLRSNRLTPGDKLTVRLGSNS